MYPYQYNQWPVGTINAIDLPPDIYAALMNYVAEDGTVAPELPVHGSYILFSGYKVRVRIEASTHETFVVRLI